MFVFPIHSRFTCRPIVSRVCRLSIVISSWLIVFFMRMATPPPGPVFLYSL